MKRVAKWALLVVFFICAGCGGIAGDLFDYTVPTQVDPIITRTNPTSAQVGDTVQIFGVGFSSVPELNIVVIGSAEAFADSYTLLPSPSGDEVERLTFTVPTGLAAGTYSIYLVVVDNPSNTDVTITINP